MTTRLVVLVSGGGTNLQAVMDACAAGTLDATVVAVVANKPEAFGLERARLAGIPAVVVERDGRARPAYDAALAEVVAGFDPDIVVLAGWMRIITMAFLRHFRILNLHPALPGMFPGIRAIERAFEAWQSGSITQSGVMIHWVPDEGVDDGPVIVDQAVPFMPEDTLETFELRLHAVEHELLIDGIGLAIVERAAEEPSVTPLDSAEPLDSAVSRTSSLASEFPQTRKERHD